MVMEVRIFSDFFFTELLFHAGPVVGPYITKKKSESKEKQIHLFHANKYRVQPLL